MREGDAPPVTVDPAQAADAPPDEVDTDSEEAPDNWFEAVVQAIVNFFEEIIDAITR